MTSCIKFSELIHPYNAVALCSSGYPCYRNIMKATGLQSVSIKVNENFKVTATELQCEIDRRNSKGLQPLKGLIMSSPSNPTGAMLSPEELKNLCDLCTQHDIAFLSDEIYHGSLLLGKTWQFLNLLCFPITLSQLLDIYKITNIGTFFGIGISYGTQKEATAIEFSKSGWVKQ